MSLREWRLWSTGRDNIIEQVGSQNKLWLACHGVWLKSGTLLLKNRPTHTHTHTPKVRCKVTGFHHNILTWNLKAHLFQSKAIESDFLNGGHGETMGKIKTEADKLISFNYVNVASGDRASSVLLYSFEEMEADLFTTVSPCSVGKFSFCPCLFHIVCTYGSFIIICFTMHTEPGYRQSRLAQRNHASPLSKDVQIYLLSWYCCNDLWKGYNYSNFSLKIISK